jgi:hypothetical protein
MELKIKSFFENLSFSGFCTITSVFPFHQHLTIPQHSYFLPQRPYWFIV